jgi:hypothetical protein
MRFKAAAAMWTLDSDSRQPTLHWSIAPLIFVEMVERSES